MALPTTPRRDRKLKTFKPSPPLACAFLMYGAHLKLITTHAEGMPAVTFANGAYDRLKLEDWMLWAISESDTQEEAEALLAELNAIRKSVGFINMLSLPPGSSWE